VPGIHAVEHSVWIHIEHHEDNDSSKEWSALCLKQRARTDRQWAYLINVTGRNGRFDVSIFPKCAGEAKVIASIENQAVIAKILNHLQAQGAITSTT
jgi:hypothetical protein